MSRFNTKFIIILVLTILVLIIGVGLYLSKFSSSKLSTEPNDWGAFGEYFNLLIGIVNLTILYRISEVANIIQKGTLLKQLKTDIYKDFIQKIDNHSEKIISCLFKENDISDSSEIKILSHLMLTIVENGKFDFEVLLENKHTEFQVVCSDLMNAVKSIRDNGDINNTEALINDFLIKKSAIRIYLYKEIKHFVL